MVRLGGGEIVPVHFSNIVALMDRLLSMVESGVEEAVILGSIVEFMRHIYSGCVSEHVLNNVIEKTIRAQSLEGTTQPLSGIQIEVLDRNIEATKFLENTVAKYRKDDFEKYRLGEESTIRSHG